MNDMRFELSFKDLYQLENKLNFCLLNKINKINIPCKGIIKKEFLNEIVDYLGKNYKDLDIIYHYSLYHQYTKNREKSYSEFINFLNKVYLHGNREILLLSGSNKKKNFEVLDVLNNLCGENCIKMNIGVAYNPYLKGYFNDSKERERFIKKVETGLIKSIWLQFGTDIKLLEKELDFLKNSIQNISSNNKIQNVRFFGSLLIPSRQFIARFKFRPWKGVYISDMYLHSLEKFNEFTYDLIGFYLENNIHPVIETECSSSEKLKKIYTLFNI